MRRFVRRCLWHASPLRGESAQTPFLFSSHVAITARKEYSAPHWGVKSMEITYPFMEDLDTSELFDDSMYNAVSEFQEIHGLGISGEIDKQTWDRLALAYDRSLWAD